MSSLSAILPLGLEASTLVLFRVCLYPPLVPLGILQTKGLTQVEEVDGAKNGTRSNRCGDSYTTPG